MLERVIRVDAATPGGRIEADCWRLLTAEEAADPPEGPIIVPLASWLADREAWIARGNVGVRLDPAGDPLSLAQDVATLPLVAIHFPKFTDGRGHSTAVLLRSRLGYLGELRAFGDVGRDQLFQLKRCGFDAFVLAPHRDPDAALPGLADFSLRYQASVDDPQPLFRKRLAAAASP
jgi:uncharacterized protein (DUF934 family)